MNSQSDLSGAIISERLKFLVFVLMVGRIDDAAKEIAEIRTLDSANPYALAYEERIRSIKASMGVQAERSLNDRVEHMMPDQSVPAFPKLTHKNSAEEFEECGSSEIDAFLHSAESQQPKFVDSTARMPTPHDRDSKGRANIVLVDDDELLLMALVELFQDNEYTTNSFTKAEDALQFLKGHKPDLVLCDVNLSKSGFGGFTLLEKMAKLGHLHTVPFIFMSGLNDEAIIRAGKEAGADDYLTKPIEPDMLLSVVKGKLRKYRQIGKNH